MNSPTAPSPEACESAATIPDALPDEEIIRRVLDGDTASFELIMRRYNQRLFRLVRGIIASEAETEEIMQEAYLRAYRHLGRFEGRSKFSTWLAKIAMREAMARRRKQRQFRFFASCEPMPGSASRPSPDRDAAEEATLKELRLVLAAAVDALPPDLRVVFTMRMVERLSTEQTAECLDLTTANVKVRLHRARQALRLWIDKRIGEEARRLYVFAGEDCDRVTRNVLGLIANDRI